MNNILLSSWVISKILLKPTTKSPNQVKVAQIGDTHGTRHQQEINLFEHVSLVLLMSRLIALLTNITSEKYCPIFSPFNEKSQIF